MKRETESQYVERQAELWAESAAHEQCLMDAINNAHDKRLAARDGKEHSVLICCPHCRDVVPVVTLDMDDVSLLVLFSRHVANCDHAKARAAVNIALARSK